jgi:prepilin-type processing-associated H-X9-DG protein
MIEFVVAIAVVAVLAGTAAAVVTAAGKKADLASCANKLHQLGVGLAEYRADAGRYPSRNGGVTWDSAIMPYLGECDTAGISGGKPILKTRQPELAILADLFVCPADRAVRAGGVYPRSYAITPWTTNWSDGKEFHGWRDQPFNEGVPMSMVRNPARAALLVEWHEGDEGVPNHLGSIHHAYHNQGGPAGAARCLHAGRSNVLFADGHIEVLPLMSEDEFIRRYWPGGTGAVR